MGRKEKLLEKAIRNPEGMRLKEFITLMNLCGWVFDRQSGSHQIFYSPGNARISIQVRKDGKAKGYQVKQFLEVYEKGTDITAA